MSANILDSATLTRGTKDDDGNFVLSKNEGADNHDSPMWEIDGQPTLAENQTMHCACSVMPDEDWASGSCWMSAQYVDAAGNFNWAQVAFDSPARAGTWTRLEATVVIPSGMRVTRAVLSNLSTLKPAGAKVANPCLSYGGPVTLASSTGDASGMAALTSLATSYRTAARQDVLDDAIRQSVSETLTSAKSYSDGLIKTEVTERDAAITAKASEITSSVSKTYATQESLSQLSTKVTQNADGIEAEVANRGEAVRQASSDAAKATQDALTSAQSYADDLVSMSVDGITQTLTCHDEALGDLQAVIRTYQGDDGSPVLELGASGSDASTRITNSETDYLVGGVVRASTSADGFSAGQLDADRMTIGGFSVDEGSDGSVTITWKGV